MKKIAMNPLIKTLLVAAATSVLLAACGNVPFQSPEEMGKVMVDTVYRQQCAGAADAAARLRCQREAEKQMQQYRSEQKNQQKTDRE